MTLTFVLIYIFSLNKWMVHAQLWTEHLLDANMCLSFFFQIQTVYTLWHYIIICFLMVWSSSSRRHGCQSCTLKALLCYSTHTHTHTHTHTNMVKYFFIQTEKCLSRGTFLKPIYIYIYCIYFIVMFACRRIFWWNTFFKTSLWLHMDISLISINHGEDHFSAQSVFSVLLSASYL